MLDYRLGQQGRYPVFESGGELLVKMTGIAVEGVNHIIRRRRGGRLAQTGGQHMSGTFICRIKLK